jgi:2'-5' RNA ligase
MSGTLAFYQGPSRRPKQPERLFFCFLLGAEASGPIGRFQQWLYRQYHLKGTLLDWDRLHVSVQHVGNYPRLRDKFVFAAAQAANSVSLPAFEIAFSCMTSFESLRRNAGASPRHPLVLLGDGGDVLFEFHQVLGAAMVRNGLRAAAHFVPRLTLYYGPEWFHLQAVGPFRFLVKEFVLIHSEVGLSRYHIRGRWPLYH